MKHPGPTLPPLPLLPDLVLPKATQAALLLDLDGTLLDIAPTPNQVVVSGDLPAHLLAARHRLGGALAVVSGRPVGQIDGLLGAVPYAVAGEHGSAIRHSPTGVIERAPLPGPPETWLTEAERLATAHPGAWVERKHHGFVLHHRAAPEAGPGLEAGLRVLLAESTTFVLLPALLAWEIRPIGTDKGTAVDALMRRAPFAGRLPIFIGDDVTDEDGMRASRAHGGIGLRVAEAFGSAQAVRDWLSRIGAP